MRKIPDGNRLKNENKHYGHTNGNEAKMRKNLKCQFIRRQSGFTLIELSIVIALMVILYALAAPS